MSTFEDFTDSSRGRYHPLVQKPPTGPSLRPSDEYVHGKIRPLVHDFRKRREYTVLQDLRSTVEEVSSIVDVYTDS